MTLHRFYSPHQELDGHHLILDEAESRHAANVLRLQVGDMVSVFDGQGTEVHARIADLNKRQTVLEAVQVIVKPPLPARLILAQAIPKGKNLDLVLQKATELGAAEIIPLVTDRTVARPDAAEAADKQEKWQRIAIEACKQCGRNHLAKVHPPIAYSTFLKNLPDTQLPLIAALDDSARPLHEILAAQPARPDSALILIGPEGDFTPEEIAAAKAAGCLPVSLGPIILRTETAAVYSLSVLGHELFRAGTAGAG
jgi:16S rRNA (uracil1498-N3)-methyltransferase